MSLLVRVDNLLCFYRFFLIFPGTVLSRIWKCIVFEQSSQTESFLKSFGKKDDRQHTKVFMCFLSCLEQPSVLENVYRLHYNSFKEKGQKILRVSFSLLLLSILIVVLLLLSNCFMMNLKLQNATLRRCLCWVYQSCLLLLRVGEPK